MRKLLNTLYVTMQDVYLSLEGENIVIIKDKTEIGRVPLHNIDSIICFSYLGASPALMGKCVSDKKSLVFLNPQGKFLARVEGTISGNVLLRKNQYRISDNKNVSIKIARNMTVGKIYNSRQVIMRTIRDHEYRIDVQLFRQKAHMLKNGIEACYQVDNMDSLRGIEGENASVYFSVFNDMILQQKDIFSFNGRSRRPPLDRVNALLSFSYSLCTSMCVSALEAVGLDPYVGFMHTDRPGRKSLALDLVEEFRPWMCDRFTLMLINKRMVDEDDFIVREDGAVLLNESGRKNVLSAWQTRKNEVIKHPFLKEKVEWGMLPYVQALLLARMLRGDLDEYPVFMWK